MTAPLPPWRSKGSKKNETVEPPWWICRKCGLTTFNHGSRRCVCPK